MKIKYSTLFPLSLFLLITSAASANTSTEKLDAKILDQIESAHTFKLSINDLKLIPDLIICEKGTSNSTTISGLKEAKSNLQTTADKDTVIIDLSDGDQISGYMLLLADLKDLASKVLSNKIDFESYATKSEEEIRKELITIKGIGNWSIEVYLMFCLQSPDIIPLGDIAIKNTLKELYNCETVEEMKSISDNWRPFRTFASYTIWHYYLKKRSKV